MLDVTEDGREIHIRVTADPATSGGIHIRKSRGGGGMIYLRSGSTDMGSNEVRVTNAWFIGLSRQDARALAKEIIKASMDEEE